MINKFILEGRPTSDPKISFTNTSNRKVANVRMAVRKSKDHTDFIDVVAWDNVAEMFQNYVKKGDLISVEGRLEPVKRQKDDFSYWQLTPVIQQVNFLSTKKQEKSDTDRNIVPQSDDYEYSDFDYQAYV